MLHSDGHVRVATKAAVLGLYDARRANLSQFTQETPSLALIQRAISVATKCVPYHDSAFLYYLVRALRPTVVVETGVWYGYSSTFILAALDETHQGRLCSIDLKDPNFPTSLQEGFVVPQELRTRWDLMLGPSREILPEAFTKYPVVDLFVHDSDHSYENMMYEFQTAWTKLRQGGVLVADNIELNESFDDFCSIVGVKGVKVESLTSTHGAVIKLHDKQQR